MDRSRRDFIKSASIVSLVGVTGGALTVLNSCTKNDALNPFTNIRIDQKTCIGCGECLPACFFDAISLPERSVYYINIDDCTECTKCLPYCTKNAIKVSTINFNIIESNCVGCGKCIAECYFEGNAITYSRVFYSVKDKCKNQRCRIECAAACEFDAISYTNGRAEIDMSKCTLCGLCVAACTFGCIKPALAKKDQEKCNHCGKCYKVCSFAAVERNEPEGYAPPQINRNLCTSCGDCIVNNACKQYNAILRNLFIADILEPNCRQCGECIDHCRFDSISKQ